MNVDLVSGALGAEVNNFDLNFLSNKNFEEVNNLLLEHKVVFFRDQSLTLEKFIKIASMFGPIEEHAYVKGIEKYPQITRIIKAANEKNQWGEGWHSDVSYDLTPSKVIILKSLKIPPIGGDTVFSNMELALETLDEDIKKIIQNKRAIHTSNGSKFFVENYSKMESNGKIGEQYSNEHPIIRTHPETGKKILYVNPTYTKKIVGLPDDESSDLLNNRELRNIFL